MNLKYKNPNMKNSSVLINVLLVLVVAFFINSCEKDKNEETITSNLTGNWTVISFEDYETLAKITKTIDNTWPQFNNGDITVNFTMSTLSSGIIAGHNVTGSFHGNFTIDQKGRIFIYNVIWTAIGVPEWGYLFNFIEKAETYEIRGGQLIIFYNQKKNSITLQKS
jgi:hypothetical protein